MIEPQKKELPGLVDGNEQSVTYTVTPFPAMQGMRMAVKLAKTFGGGIGKVGKLATGNGANSEQGQNILDMDVGQVIDGILANLDENETPKLVAELLNGTQRNGVFLTEQVIDKVYTQNFGELFKALQFSLEVNFGGFFGALAQASSSIGSPAANAVAKG